MITPRTFRLRFQGREYGPFSRSQIKSWLADRDVGPEDMVLDETVGTWLPLSGWKVEEEVAPELFTGVTVASTYVKVTYAGALLVLVWGLAFVGMRLYTGKWPGEGVPKQNMHYMRDAVEDTPVVSPDTRRPESL